MLLTRSRGRPSGSAELEQAGSAVFQLGGALQTIGERTVGAGLPWIESERLG
jgi:hypothetical protein